MAVMEKDSHPPGAVIAVLGTLLRINLAVMADYDRVLGGIADEIMHARLTAFREKHQAHVSALSDAIRSMGDSTPEQSKTPRKGLLAWVASFFSPRSTRGALVALKRAEENSYRHYNREVSAAFPRDIKEMLRAQFTDEKIHLDYIAENLKVLKSSE